MVIAETTLRSAANRQYRGGASSLREATQRGLRSIFLCHSHRDKILAQGLVTLLAEHGWSAYVDWNDATMPQSPNKETADRIRDKIAALTYFMYLVTENSLASRWCPWELGIADGRKPFDKIVVVATSNNAGEHGNEYVQLYNRLEFSSENALGVWAPGDSKSGVLIRNL